MNLTRAAALLLAGCIGLSVTACAANKPSRDMEKNMREYGTKTTSDTRMLETDQPPQNRIGTSEQTNRHNNSKVGQDPQLAARIRTVSGVQQAQTAVTDRNVYVAVQLSDTGLKKTQHGNPGNKGKLGPNSVPDNRDSTGQAYQGLSLDVSQAITDMARAAFPDKSVFVTADQAFYEKLNPANGPIVNVDDFNRLAELVFRTNNNYRMGR
ncbi:YhcN/YlaJ family sporulation lipoprotein [Paenibacillus sp. MBLB4367]|uniref:YhcN/YlaJ family sporulation lipoprotein n=1 Tax=Paenibacillus sp. MBLB4367 TaxID=3384767 RepID=UPI003908182C